MAQHIVAKYGGKGLHELFAAMPPFEMVKLLLIRAVSDKIKSLEKSRSNEMAGRTARAVRGSSRPEAVRKVMFIDVSKAHLYALINSDIDAFVDLPPECAKPGVCGRLN